MWQIIRDLVADGVTIFLTTQYLEEADQLADRIAVLDHGRLVAEGTPDELKRLVPGGHVRLRFADPAGSSSRPASSTRPHATTTRSPCRCPATAASRSLRALLDRLDDASVEVDELSVHTPDLDDVFLALTGQPDTATPTAEGDRPMSTLAYAVRDSRTMLRRNLRHMLRYPSMTLMLIGMPVIFLLLFVYVFGGTLGAGLGGDRPAAAPSTPTTSSPASC